MRKILYLRVFFVLCKIGLCYKSECDLCNWWEISIKLDDSILFELKDIDDIMDGMNIQG